MNVNARSNEVKAEAVELVLCLDWPNLYLDRWARAHECSERGVDPSDDVQNALENFLDAHEMSFEQFMDTYRDAAHEVKLSR